jgi:hypothetical protein
MVWLKVRYLGLVLLLGGAMLILAGGAHAQADFSVIAFENYKLNATEGSAATSRFVPGQYQARMHLANGYVGLVACQSGT